MSCANTKTIRRIVPFLICLPFLLASGQEIAKWDTCYGEAPIQNITPEEAQVLAIRGARLAAIEKVCGINLQAESFVNQFVLTGDYIHAISYGQILEEKILKWEPVTSTGENPSSPPVVKLKLTMLAKVLPVKEKPDPSFKIDMGVNRTSFQSGEEVIVRMKATKDCYVTVLNMAANDSVYILFPNFFRSACPLDKGNWFEFPTVREREEEKHIRVYPIPGHAKDTEMIRVIAIKRDVPLMDVLPENAYGSLGTPRVAFTKIAQWLSEIPVSDRAEASVVYTVEAKKED